MVEKIRRYERLRSRSVSGGRETASSSDLPLDEKLSFNPSPDEHWTFERGQICMDGLDMEDMARNEDKDIKFLAGLSSAVHEYQLYVWSKGGKNQADFNARIRALQDSVHSKLCRIYDNMNHGVSFEMQDGELWLNNINVRKVIYAFYRNPSESVRKYLISLRDKVGLIMSRRQASKRFDGIYKEADSIYKDLELALEYIPADAPPRISEHSGLV